jgi:hypothetical protein
MEILKVGGVRYDLKMVSFFHTHGITINLQDNVYVTNRREILKYQFLIAMVNS